MSKLQNAFTNKNAFVGYLTAGDGGLEHSFQAMLALIEGGVDILEVGMPFSDPVADGPSIQQASERALAAGTTINDVLNLIKKLRQHTDIPIVLFGYYNPIFNYGSTFFQDAKNAGADGCLIVDLPLEESDEYLTQCQKHNLDSIMLISTSTSDERIRELSNKGSGMLYYACRKGTTGVKKQLPEDFIEKVNNIKSITQLPLVAGFGISNKDMAQDVLAHTDGFVVGSLFVNAANSTKDYQALTQLAQSLDPRQGPQ